MQPQHSRSLLKKILADPCLRRRLMVSTIQATQAREGIVTSIEQAEHAWDKIIKGKQSEQGEKRKRGRA